MKINAEKRRIPVKKIKKDMGFYLLLLPAILLTFVFSYCTMPGILYAFQDYDFVKGMFGSPWVGFKHIVEIFTMANYREAIVNTIFLNVLTIAAYIFPVIFALLLNEVKDGIVKKSMQTISYLPHFLSWVSIVAITYSMFSKDGIINDIRVALLGADTQRIMFMANKNNFVPFYLFLTVWQSLGWDAVIFLAAISGVDQQLYEAVTVDGGNRFHRVWYVTLPSIMPTVIIMFILKIGGMFGSNFELVYGLQNAYMKTEVISTIIYKSGVQQANYSMSTALGLVQGVLGFAIMSITNQISKKVNEVSLW